jgi:hypothetical protein
VPPGKDDSTLIQWLWYLLLGWSGYYYYSNIKNLESRSYLDIQIIDAKFTAVLSKNTWNSRPCSKQLKVSSWKLAVVYRITHTRTHESIGQVTPQKCKKRCFWFFITYMTKIVTFMKNIQKSDFNKVVFGY